METLKHCKECARPMVSSKRWAVWTRDQRAASGHVEHAGRDLCRRCWIRSRRPEYVTPNTADRLAALEWVAEEWEFLSNPHMSQGQNAKWLAPRMGLHPDTLERYLRFLRIHGRLPELEKFRGPDGRMAAREVAA